MQCRCELLSVQLHVCTWSGVAVLTLYWCDLPHQVWRQWWSLMWRKCSGGREWWPKSIHGLRWEVSLVVSQCPIPNLSKSHSIPCPPVCIGWGYSHLCTVGGITPSSEADRLVSACVSFSRAQWYDCTIITHDSKPRVYPHSVSQPLLPLWAVHRQGHFRLLSPCK